MRNLKKGPFIFTRQFIINYFFKPWEKADCDPDTNLLGWELRSTVRHQELHFHAPKWSTVHVRDSTGLLLSISEYRPSHLQAVMRGPEGQDKKRGFWRTRNHSFRRETAEYWYTDNTPGGGVRNTVKQTTKRNEAVVNGNKTHRTNYSQKSISRTFSVNYLLTES